MGGGQGISQALQTASPLLLSMAAGLRSGQGAAAGMPLGLAQMMQMQQNKAAERGKADAASSYGSWNAGGNSGGGPMLNGGFTGAGMGDRNAPDPMAGKPPVPAAASAGGTPKLVFDTLTKQGMPAHIAHGVLGNLKQESGFNSGAYNAKEGAFGLGQWRGDRLENLKRYAQAQGKEISDATVQAEFIGHELSTTESAAWEKIQRAKTPEEAAAAFDQHYERSSGEHVDARVKNAQDYAQGYQSTFGEAAAPVDPMSDPQVQGMVGWLAQHGEADPARAAAVKEQLTMRVNYLGQQNSGQGISDAQAIQFGLQEAGQQPGPPEQITPYQQANIDLDRQRLEMDKQAAGIKSTTDATDAKLKAEESLRKEFIGIKPVQEFQVQATAMGRIIAAADDPSPAGDMALIFGYMKLLDPGSTVREGEYATAANAGSISDRIYAMYNKARSGEALADGMREDFLGRAQKLYKNSEKQYDTTYAQYKKIAEKKGLDVVSALPDYRNTIEMPRSPTAPTAQADGPVRVKTVQEANELPSGTQFIDPLGNVRVKP